MLSIATIKNTFKSNIKSNLQSTGKRIVKMEFVADKSSVWNPVDTVDLLVKLSEISTVSTNDATEYRKIQKDCLEILKNLSDKWGNNMKYFWNGLYDFVKDRNESLINQNAFKEAFAMAEEHSVASNSCANAFVMKAFDNAVLDVIRRTITEFFSKYTFKTSNKGLITSFIGPHRNMAPAGFFKKLNGA
jgi:hypothetical protein